VGDLRLAQQQGAVLGAAGVIREGPTGSLQPTGGGGGTGSQAVVLVKPHRAHARSALFAQHDEDPVCRLTGLDALLDPTEPPRGVGHEIETLGLYPRLVNRQLAHQVMTRLPGVTG
jgi:hypothetical protein